MKNKFLLINVALLLILVYTHSYYLDGIYIGAFGIVLLMVGIVHKKIRNDNESRSAVICIVFSFFLSIIDMLGHWIVSCRPEVSNEIQIISTPLTFLLLFVYSNKWINYKNQIYMKYIFPTQFRLKVKNNNIFSLIVKRTDIIKPDLINESSKAVTIEYIGVTSNALDESNVNLKEFIKKHKDQIFNDFNDKKKSKPISVEPKSSYETPEINIKNALKHLNKQATCNKYDILYFIYKVNEEYISMKIYVD